ncbi:hypothetical protein [Nocardioides ochotonae]|uniref:hypothetical protein n=1 Tax=Nocardioides ochotonae TaxID=2685869 RepID=UPI00140847F8|nr:hypothetical protein [Nocardioides ochotonae]
MTRADDEQDAQVRRLLAEARHDEPVPDDIAQRLERVLAQLAADGPVDAPPADEVAARRRRRAGGLLVAAAAVVVAAVGVDQVIDSGAETASSSDSSSAAGQATSAEDAAVDRSTSTLPRRKAPSPTGGPVDVHADHFTRDARALLRATETVAPLSANAGKSGSDRRAELYRDRAPVPGDGAGKLEQRAPARGTAWFSCDPAPWGPGRLLAVRYDDEPAVVAIRPPAGDTRVVEVLQCGTGTILRSVTLPRR